ncbi:glycosyltransferase family 1 protein [Timonella senegalensis]|uniref:glycosyltransferase family 4 protein n=1 Tax=Timonella senegalensis TaxID=1465825 RepID=UPI002FDEF5E8
MRVLFDGFWIEEGPISNRMVQLEVIKAWARTSSDEVHVVVDQAFTMERAEEIFGDLPITFHFVRRSLHPIFNTRSVSRIARRVNADEVVSHNFAPLFLPKSIRNKVFIHDVIFMRKPEWFTFAERLYLGLIPVLLRVARRSEIFTSSNTEAKLIEEQVKRGVTPVGLALESDFVKSTPCRPEALGASNTRYILSVGRINARKNLAVLLDAYMKSEIGAAGVKLCIVGEVSGLVGELASRIEAAISSGDVILLSRLTPGEMKYLYANTECFVFPSLDEGFGLPALESYVYSPMVIANDISVFHEILGSVGNYVDCESSAELAGALRAFLHTQTDPLQAPRKHSYSWEQTVFLMRGA